MFKKILMIWIIESNKIIKKSYSWETEIYPYDAVIEVINKKIDIRLDKNILL